MKKVLIASVATAALFVAGCSHHMENGEMASSSAMPPAEKMEMQVEKRDMAMKSEKKDMMDKMPEETQKMAGKMLPYSAGNLSNSLENGETVVLAFAADWCPSCVAVEKDIMKNLKNIPENVTLIRADYDAESELKKRYGVTGQHTFVQLDQGGDEVKRWRGSPSFSALISEIQ